MTVDGRRDEPEPRLQIRNGDVRYAPTGVPVEAARLEQNGRSTSRDRVADERAAVTRVARIGGERDVARGGAAVRRDTGERTEPRHERVGLRHEEAHLVHSTRPAAKLTF